MVHDNTKPSVRMGRKAYRVSSRQPGCRNINRYSAPAFLCLKSIVGRWSNLKSNVPEKAPDYAGPQIGSKNIGGTRKYSTIRKDGAESFRVSRRQPGCQNTIWYQVPVFCRINRCRAMTQERGKCSWLLLQEIGNISRGTFDSRANNKRSNNEEHQQIINVIFFRPDTGNSSVLGYGSEGTIIIFYKQRLRQLP